MMRRKRENAQDRARRVQRLIKKYGSLEAAIEAKQGRVRRKSVFHGRYGYASRNNGMVRVRSGWELTFCGLLDALDLEWYYEPSTFRVMGKEYTPDFFVYTPLGGCYVELHVMTKGWRDHTIEKILAAEKAIPLGANWPLVILDQLAMKSVIAFAQSLS